MTAISWKNAVNGDWNNSSNWSTNTVPGSGDAVTISASGPYIVSISSADVASSLTFTSAAAALLETAGSLTMAGALTVDAGFVSLNRANTIGSVTIAGGELAFGAAGALGAGTVALSGELLATANETLANTLAISGNATIAAARGTTLNENAATWSVAANTTLNIGALGQDGTVLWHTNSGSAFSSPFNVHIQAGTLKDADGQLSSLLEHDTQTTLDAGATLDVAGFNEVISNLVGGGNIVNSGAAAILHLSGANFSGVISGAQFLETQNTAILTGANTYTGSTVIEGGTLQLGNGGATGSIGAGIITIFGALIIDRGNAVTLANNIQGSGTLSQIGNGVTSINAANSYSGGTTVSAGTLAIGDAGALGTGAVTLSGGELLATANETLTNALLFSGSSTIAAAHGTTLNENASSYSVNGNSTLNFGALGQDGTILWSTNGGAFSPPFPVINVQAGTLKGANGSLGFLLGGSPIAVAAGATLDLSGSSAEFTDLSGGGSVIDSGAADTLTLDAANFSGVIAGPQSLFFAGNASLSGVEDYTGGATLQGPVTVANSGTYDIVSNNGIAGTPASLFVNDGLFEKTGGGGRSKAHV